MQADDPGGLHLTAAHKGTIYAWWFVFQSILPMLTGGYADRYGYKRVLAFSLSMIALGYADLTPNNVPVSMLVLGAPQHQRAGVA